jgi:hypothetical protein
MRYLNPLLTFIHQILDVLTIVRMNYVILDSIWTVNKLFGFN